MGEALEEELLQVGAAREEVAAEEAEDDQPGGAPAHVGVQRRAQERPDANAIEERVEDAAAPAELEAELWRGRAGGGGTRRRRAGLGCGRRGVDRVRGREV